MTHATLTLTGTPKLDGIVETGGDFIRFLIGGDVETYKFAHAAEGEIEIDGKAEKVTLEGSGPGSVQGQRGTVLTFRRHTPAVTSP